MWIKRRQTMQWEQKVADWYDETKVGSRCVSVDWLFGRTDHKYWPCCHRHLQRSNLLNAAVHKYWSCYHRHLRGSNLRNAADKQSFFQLTRSSSDKLTLRSSGGHWNRAQEETLPIRTRQEVSSEGEPRFPNLSKTWLSALSKGKKEVLVLPTNFWLFNFQSGREWFLIDKGAREVKSFN
jgi:hypothetical protein